ncbi:cytochrome P450, partial [Dendrothele bispora CBS 962.96]
SSTALAWTLYALSQNPQIQSRLRDELFSLQTPNPTLDELNNLPYLDAIVRETLRLCCPVTSPNRVAMKDDRIPLSSPYTDRKGRICTDSELVVKKGQTITVPIVSVNRDKYLWGEDAKEFNPERWYDLPEAVSAIPGVWGNMLTFFGGPRSCIGWRFALVE